MRTKSFRQLRKFFSNYLFKMKIEVQLAPLISALLMNTVSSVNLFVASAACSSTASSNKKTFKDCKM